MLQILPITLAQVKVSNTLENLLNIQDIQDYFEYLIKKSMKHWLIILQCKYRLIKFKPELPLKLRLNFSTCNNEITWRHWNEEITTDKTVKIYLI